MGKGRGAAQTPFQRFLDESYFSFVFLNWAIALSTVGIVLIVIGIVVNAVYPPQANAKFADTQSLTNNEASYIYSGWATANERTAYYFQDAFVNSTLAPTCNNVGPYVYQRTVSKVNVDFSSDGNEASYRLTYSKVFNAADSVSRATVTTVNPNYAEVVNGYGSEEELFAQVSTAVNFTTGIQRLFQTYVPILITAEGLRVQLGTDFDSNENRIYNDFFATPLGTAISNYKYKYLNTQLTFFRYNGTTKGIPSSPVAILTGTGIYGNIVGRFINSPGCTTSASTTIDAELVNGFTNVPAGACKDFLSEYSLSVAATGKTFGAAEARLYFDAFVPDSNNNVYTQGVDDFWKASDPDSGYCGASQRASSYSLFSSTADRLDYICDVYIPKWYDLLVNQTVTGGSVTVNRMTLGEYKFCKGTLTLPALTSTPDPYLFPATFPTPFLNSLAQTTALSPYLSTFSLGYQSTFNLADCQTVISELTTANRAYQLSIATAPANPIDGSTITLTTLQTYFKRFAGVHKAFYVYGLVQKGSDPTFAPYTFAFPYLASGSISVSASDVNNVRGSSIFAIAAFFWPRLTIDYPSALEPNRFTLQIGVNVSNTVQGAANVYDQIQSVNGIAGMILETNSDSTTSQDQAYQLASAAQFYALQSWMQKAMTFYATNTLGVAYAQVGNQQFAKGTLIPGQSNTCNTIGQNLPKLSCSISRYFFQLADTYAPELSLAVYNGPYDLGTTPFTAADISGFNMDVTQAQNILDALSTSPTTFINTKHAKYSYYIWNTYILARFPGSGLFAKRPYSDLILGYTDELLRVVIPNGPNKMYAIDADGMRNMRVWTVRTGTDNIGAAFLLSKVDGNATLTGYWPADVGVEGLFTVDQFPSRSFNSVSMSADEPADFSIMNTEMQRPFAWAFNGSQTTVSDISGYVGALGTSQWAENTDYGMIGSLQPIRPNVKEYYGPCSQAVSSATCGFAGAGMDGEIVVEPLTGQVLSYSECHVRYARVSGVPFNVTHPELSLTPGADADILMTQVMRQTQRSINVLAANEVSSQLNTAASTGRIVLIVFVILGVIFLVGGLTFLTFYILKKQREEKFNAERELVADPFAEKNDRSGF